MERKDGETIMSGEATGILIGGALLIGALPVILAGAAVIGAAAGAAKVGSSAMKAHAARKQEEERRQKLEISQCSREMSDMYDRLRSVMARQSERSREYDEAVARQMTEFSARLRSQAQNAKDAAQMERVLREARERNFRALTLRREQEISRIHEEARQETGKILHEMERAQAENMKLSDWQKDTASAKAAQKTMAMEFLRDAGASVRLLENLARSSYDENFRLRVQTQRRSYETAQQSFQKGIYQAAIANAQQIVIRGASLAVEHEQKEQELYELRTAVEARLEGLGAEMDTQEKVVFQDELYGQVEEFLDDFTQGGFDRVRKEIDAMLSELRSENGRSYSAVKLHEMQDDIENRLVPHAADVIRVGYEKIQGYYERLHALQIISAFMKDQGYSMSWAQPAGDDMTQKLVISFRESTSGNTVSVSLDEDADVREIGRMVMEVMFYYDNGRPVTEQEKQALRGGMTDALRKAGLSGALNCSGAVNQPAENQTFNSAESVRNLRTSSVL